MINKIKSVYRFLSPNFQSIHLDYRVSTAPRYGSGKPAHPELYDVVNKNRLHYSSLLDSILKYATNIHQINKTGEESDENKPVWNNGFLPGLDIVSLYGIVADYKPQKYIEIGSGNSTKVV